MDMVSIENAEHYVWGEKCDGWHLVKTPNLSIIREKIPSGFSETQHYHVKAEQCFFVLSGVADFEIDGKQFKLMAEQSIHILAGVPHLLKNESSEDLEFIVTSTPPSHGDRVEL